jgi:MoxR-like ATPase
MVDGFRLYAGDGTPITERNLRLPLSEHDKALDAPSGYLAEPALRDAVNVALALGQPLLVTGEPGTGKTQLAASVAHELNLASPLVFHTKTTSTARDLLYRYDALRHFHDAQFADAATDPEKYISYEALGQAILLSLSPDEANRFLPAALQNRGPVRSVVLIDEVDKAPRDFPNDLLHEIEHMSFTVDETGRSFMADTRYRPIVILTSNLERDIPHAFLRRCVFYYISFPNRDRLTDIVTSRVRPDGRFTPEMLAHAVAHFEAIREMSLKKRPATAEFLSWVRILMRMEIDVANVRPGQAEALAFSYSVLAKDKDDLERMQKSSAAVV